MENRAVIECFHLAFCHRLGAKVNRRFFSLKGGCNLRFYFQSIRYSEDIDFDVTTISVSTLKRHVDRILNDQSFRTTLRINQKIEIVHWSAPKQTETTQRWKVSVQLGTQLPIPTKIEFSRRESEITGAEIGQVTAQVTTGHKLQPLLLQHYMLPKAIEQKIGALIHRTETQARDVIDLQILIDQIVDRKVIDFSFTQDQKKKALETLLAVSFDDFKSQVWPYLLREYQEYYNNVATWNQTQASVVRFIDELPGIK